MPTPANTDRGGNDAAIVCADVDIQKVATDLVFGAFFNTGQVCTGTKRIYIHEDIYAETLQAMAVAAKKLKVGNGGDAGVIIGPLQNKMQYEKVKNLYAEAEKNKFKVHDGDDISSYSSKGFFLQPKIIDNPPDDSLIITEEQMVGRNFIIIVIMLTFFRGRSSQLSLGRMKPRSSNEQTIHLWALVLPFGQRIQLMLHESLSNLK